MFDCPLLALGILSLFFSSLVIICTYSKDKVIKGEYINYIRIVLKSFIHKFISQ